MSRRYGHAIYVSQRIPSLSDSQPSFFVLSSSPFSFFSRPQVNLVSVKSQEVAHVSMRQRMFTLGAPGPLHIPAVVGSPFALTSCQYRASWLAVIQSGAGSTEGCAASRWVRSNAIASCVARSITLASFSFRSKFWSSMVTLDHYKVCANAAHRLCPILDAETPGKSNDLLSCGF